MRRFSDAQRRARLQARHHLARPASDVHTVAGDLVGLHATDPATPYLAARARVAGFEREDLEAALYVDRTLGRILGMRRTMFVVPVELLPGVIATCTRIHGDREHRRLERMVDEQGIADDPSAFVGLLLDETMDALMRRGEATAAELKEDVPRLDERITFGEGTDWAGQVGLSTRVLFLLATQSLIIRGRPGGTWKSSLYRWAPMDAWFRGTLPPTPSDDEAFAALARAYLSSYGPATFDDVVWWTGWNKTQTRTALSSLELAEVDLGGATALVLSGDATERRKPRAVANLLPALDPTAMGWKVRDHYLDPDDAAVLFDRNGNIAPTIWWEGRIVGAWMQDPAGEIRWRLLGDVGADGVAAIEAEVAATQAWLGDDRVIPRFRTPIDRELGA